MAASTPFRGVLWLVLDGASFDLVRELLDAGDLPALGDLTGGDAHPLPPLSPNCQTPPSLAAGCRAGTRNPVTPWSALPAPAGGRVTLTPGESLRSHPEPLRFGPGLATRVGTLMAGGRPQLVHTGLWELRSDDPNRQLALDEQVGAFVGKPLGEAYGGDELGPRAFEGSDGTADRALLDLVDRGQVADHDAAGRRLANHDLAAAVEGGRLEVSRVVVQAERPLRAFRDPETGGPPSDVARVPEAERQQLGDLFPSLGPGYECRAEAGPNGAEVREVAKGGTHQTPTAESTLRGIVAAGGGAGHVAGAGRSRTPTDLVPFVQGLLEARRAAQAGGT